MALRGHLTEFKRGEDMDFEKIAISRLAQDSRDKQESIERLLKDVMIEVKALRTEVSALAKLSAKKKDVAEA
jgi:hypothetical protein